MAEKMLSTEDQAMMFDGPIPGEGLTNDPDNPAPYEKPPKHVNLEDFIDELFMRLTETPEKLDGVMDPIRKGIPIEDVASILLFQAMSSGQITPDLQLLAAEPTIYMLIGLSQYAGIKDAKLYPEEDFALDDEEEIARLKGDERDGTAPDIKSMKAPEGVSKSLADKIKKGNI